MNDSQGRRVYHPSMDVGRAGQLPVRVVLRLQRTIGNREVARMLVQPASDTVALVPQPSASLQPARTSQTLMGRVGRLFRRLKNRVV